MKRIFLLLMACIMSISLFSQARTSTLTLILKGTQARRITVDGQDFTPNDINYQADATVTVDNLTPGQHQLRITRRRAGWRRNNDINTTFVIRNNYDKQITVTNSGALQQTEIAKGYGAGTKPPMSSVQFQNLLQTLSDQQGYERRTTLRDAFRNTNYYFTTQQVRQLLLLINSENNRLELAKISYRSVTDQWNFSTLYDIFPSQASRTELMSYVNRYTPGSDDYDNNGYNNNHNNDTYPPVHNAMSEVSFLSLYSGIQNEYSQSRRYSAATNLFNTSGYYFTSDQVRRILMLINDEYNRLELAKLGYSTVSDRNSYYDHLNDLFYTQDNKVQLRAYINAYGNGSGVVTVYSPMSDYNFNLIYVDVQNTYGMGGKMTALSNAFSNSNNYFTTDQAERLIRLVNNESNRLQLAKSAYSRITDPENFRNIYDVFDYQASRDELDQYVRNNPRSGGNYNNNGGYNGYGGYRNEALSEYDYNALYNNISLTFGIGAKMSALTEEFNRTNHYYTVAQVEKLIRLVSDQDNRLQLAKAAYRHIVDPERIADLYDIFDRQSTIDEFKIAVGIR